MAKALLVEINYYNYVCTIPDSYIGAVVDVLYSLNQVTIESGEEGKIYVPKDDEPIKMSFIPLESLRKLTPKERESKEISDLKSTIATQEYRMKELQEEIKTLKETKCRYEGGKNEQ